MKKNAKSGPSQTSSNGKSASKGKGRRRASKARATKIKAVVLEGFERINLFAAGIDVGAERNFVCVPAHTVKKGEANVRSFGVFTPEQDDLVSEGGRKKRQRPLHGNNGPTMDFGDHVRRICGVDLMQVCGLNLLSVLMLISEIGVDMSRWRSAKAFCSWLGLCPGTKISGGKRLSRRTRHVVNGASVLLRLAALAAGRTDTWLGRFYRRKKAHLGAPKAITATARKLACVIYHMLKYQEEFLPLDVALYDLKAQEQRMRRLRKQAEALGFDLVQRKDAA